jgi:hypothetical protein
MEPATVLATGVDDEQVARAVTVDALSSTPARPGISAH